MPRHPGDGRQLEMPPCCLQSNVTDLRSHQAVKGGEKMYRVGGSTQGLSVFRRSLRLGV